MTDAIVSLENVSFSYNGAPALEDVNLQVRRGDFLVVLGPNGGGKTTLLKCILGLLAPQKGRVQVFGGPAGKCGGCMGYVPQQSEVKRSFPITAEQVARMGVSRSEKNGREKAMLALRRVEMQDHAGKRFDALSGGQRQRVLVARALAGDPELLVLDEPTANVDPQGKVCLYDLLASLSSQATVIVVSHDLVFTAAGITSVAAVNKTLKQTRGRSLSKEMLSLLYGVHDHSCPMDELLDEVTTLFGAGAQR